MMKQTITITAALAFATWLASGNSRAAVDRGISIDDASSVMETSELAESSAKKGTATCETIERKILHCYEDLTHKEARKLCYADRRTKRIHFETNGPTCFEIINGDVEW